MYLKREGFATVVCDNGNRVLELVLMHRPALIVLDILLPGTDGIEVCRQLRKNDPTPVLFLSCKSEDMDVILGLSIGGDDYMTKPFSPAQLVARVKALLRRSELTDQHRNESQMLRYPGLEIDLVSHLVRLNGKTVQLSAKEFDLITIMAKTPNRVYALEQLYELVWDLDSVGDPRTLIVHISNIRKKIEPNPSKPKYIVTVRGFGYKFNGTYG
jgi:DNA-binding response OmpR family regulator